MSRSAGASAPSFTRCRCLGCACGEQTAGYASSTWWESAELCEQAFDERIHAAVDAAFDVRRPSELEVHRLEVLDAAGALLAGTPLDLTAENLPR